MYFWLNYCDENHVERIPTAVKNINHLIESDEDEYLSSLENFVCTEKQIQKLSI